MRAVWQPESVTRRMSEITSTALLWGFDALELRSVGGPEDRVPHVSERLIRTSCMEADLTVAALDPEFFTGPVEEKAAWMNELAMLPDVIRLARRLGKPGIILGSLEHNDGDDRSEAAAALERIFGEASRLAGREGLVLHVRMGHARHAAIVRDAILSVGSDGFRPMSEIGITLSEDEAAESPWTSGDIHIPDQVRDATYVRLIYRGSPTVSLGEADGLRDLFQDIAERLKEFGSATDVCLEFEHRPDPASGLRVSTAFVRAMSGA